MPNSTRSLRPTTTSDQAAHAPIDDVVLRLQSLANLVSRLQALEKSASTDKLATSSQARELVALFTEASAEHLKGAPLLNLMSENPSAFRRHKQDSLLEIWRLRREWNAAATALTRIAERIGPVLDNAVAPPAPAADPASALRSSAWLRFICTTIEHLSRRTDAIPASLPQPATTRTTRPARPAAPIAATDKAVARVRSSNLFDRGFYLSQIDDFALDEDQAVVHFIEEGGARRFDPHPLFSVAWYLDRHPEIATARVDPLTHYIETGSNLMWDPHPLFDTALLAETLARKPAARETWLGLFCADTASTRSPHPVFDVAAYTAASGLRTASAPLALIHYLVRGWRHGIAFSPFFDAEYYRSRFTDGDAARIEPYTHYALVGHRLGIDPHPLFDAAYYLAAQPDADSALAPGGQIALHHYLATGEALGASPSPFFDVRHYRDTYLAGQPYAGALRHFLQTGRRTDARPVPAFDSAAYRRVFMPGVDPATAPTAIEHFVAATGTGLDPAGIALLLAGDAAPASASPPLASRVVEPSPPATITPVPVAAPSRANGIQAPPPPDQPRIAGRVREDLGAALKYKGYPGKATHRPGAPNILLVAHAAGEHLFGSERSFLDMIIALAAIPANLYVVLPRNIPDYTNAIRLHAQHVSAFTYGWWRDGEEENPSAIALFDDLITGFRIDAVHANTIMLRECLTAAKARGIPRIVHVRELITADEALVKLIGRTSDEIVDAVRLRADWIIGNSQATAAAFSKPGSTLFIPNTIDMADMAFPNTVDPDRIRFGLVSSNIPKKGLADVVELARATAATSPNAEFHLIGPITAAVEDIRRQQEAGEAPANIVFPGYATSPAAALATLNVVLNFSHFAESFGRTVLEAMASGRPVIAYEWGALPELVHHGVTGYLVPYREPLAAAPFVRELCEKPDRITTLGERGIAIARMRYATEPYKAAMARAYKAILSARRPEPDTFAAPVIRHARRPGLKTVEPAPRIAYFCWHFPVPSETFVINELEVLVRDGVDVIVFCRQTPFKEFKLSFPLQFERVDQAATLARRLTETGRTMVHAHFTFPTVTDMVWPACELAQIPFTFIAHAQDIFKYDNDRRNRLAEICAAPLCRTVFTLSRFHYDFLVARGVPPNRIVINPNAVDTSRFSAAAIRSDTPTRRFRRIVAIHRFVAKKGLSLLIEAAALIRDLDIAIDLYGYGELEPEYRNLIAQLGLDNVVLKGALTQDQVVLAMQEADLFACPSIRTPEGDMDGIPTSIVESMAAGLPVLATDISGIPDLVADGVTGVICKPDPESIADAIRRFYAMPEARVRNMIDAARKHATRNHDAQRLVRVLRRVWENRTVDVVIVSWNNLEHLRAVIERALEFTALPFHLIVCDNQSRKHPVPQYLDHLWEEHDQVTIIHNNANAMVGPGTNAAMREGVSDCVIYLCGKEGFSFANGWELPFVHAFADNPQAGLVGTLGRSPTYLTGKAYPSGIPLFPKFRNQDFATANPDRIFGHIQGGLFGIRRSMVDEIGGFSDAVPHDYTDVEYSYYVESRGWELVEAQGVLALFNRSRPTLSQRFDEKILVAHPVDLDQVARFDAVRQGRLCHCNICDWYGKAFDSGFRCASCKSMPSDRTVFRFLSEGPHMYRRLPALAVGLDGRLDRVWGEQFQGPRLTTGDFRDTIASAGRLKNSDGGLRLAILRNVGLDRDETLAPIARELRRVLSPGAPILLQHDAETRAGIEDPPLAALLREGGFRETGRLLYNSTAIRYADAAVLAYERR